MKYRLPYNKQLVRDKVCVKLEDMSLEEDWLAQQLFTTIDKRGCIAAEEVPRMRRHVHVLRVFETEARMYYKAGGYHGV